MGHGTEASSGAAGPAGGGPVSVLVVDDNEDTRVTLGMVLELEGFAVRLARDAPTALEAVAAARPDAVVLDIGMPGMDGWELARRLRELAPGGSRLLLVALSGYGRSADRERSEAAGIDVHFHKPVEPDLLVQVLAAARKFAARRQEPA
ncbi:response regulator [Gemmata sp.]|uniref:response regulator n=1 Tax=Gemmata sp. TaxID=1914242 RepID=UPI003F7114B4